MIYWSEKKGALYFMHAVSGKIISNKVRIATIHSNLDTYSCPTNIDDKIIDEDIFNQLNILNHLFLRDEAEYSTSIRVQLRHILNLTYEDFLKILSKLRECL